MLPQMETSICCRVQRDSGVGYARGTSFSHGEAHYGELLVSCSRNYNRMVCKSLGNTGEKQHPAAGRKGMGEEERKSPGVSGGKMP